MLASYHLFFLATSFLLLIIGMIFLFILDKKYEWSMLIAFVILGINMIVCWICVLGFFGVQLVGLTSANDFILYTYPNMMGLNMLPFGIMMISIIVAWVGWGKHLKKVAEELNQSTIRSPTRSSNYWSR